MTDQFVPIPPVRTGYLKLADTSLYYRDYGEDTARHTLLLLHGNGESWHCFARQVGPFSACLAVQPFLVFCQNLFYVHCTFSFPALWAGALGGCAISIPIFTPNQQPAPAATRYVTTTKASCHIVMLIFVFLPIHTLPRRGGCRA